MICSRLVISYILNSEYRLRKNFNKKNILIYGAGQAGRQLADTIKNISEFRLVGFLDDNDQLQNQLILGHTIHSPNKLLV